MAPARVLLWGGRSQARIAAEMLSEGGFGYPKIIFDPSLEDVGFETQATFISDANELKIALPRLTHYVVCIGNEHGYARYRTSQYLQRAGLEPLTITHRTSFIEPTSSVGKGCQILPFALVHKFTSLGDQVIVNTAAVIDHECMVGNGVHVMGSAAVSGRVVLGDYVTIGTNATILPGIKVGEGAFVGAGAVVTRDVEPHAVVAGVPARRLRGSRLSFWEEPLKILCPEE